MDNPETQTTFAIRHRTNNKQNKTQHIQLKDEQHRAHQKTGVNLDTHEV